MRCQTVEYGMKCKDYEETHTGQAKPYLHNLCSNHLNNIKNNKGEASALDKYSLEKIFSLISNNKYAYETDYSK